jgi:transposase InsO family protein
MHREKRVAAGARMLSGQLKQEGEKVGRYKAGKLMKEAGLVSKQQRRHRYRIAEDESAIAPNHLARGFTIMKANQAWCGEVTDAWSGNEWLYLAVVIDLYKRRVIGWSCSTSPNSPLTMCAYAWLMNLESVQRALCFILTKAVITRAKLSGNYYALSDSTKHSVKRHRGESSR